jgi:transcription antitermination factor NusG
MKNWFALYVSSRQEKKIAEDFLRKGIESYCPLKKELRQWSDRKKWVNFPMLPGYLFVHISPLDRDKVLSQKGVVNFVRHNGKDALVKDREIDILRVIEQEGYYVEEKNQVINNDDLVEILEGPFKGLKGIVENKLDENIVYVVLIESISQALKIKVPKKNLLKLI